jgi:hypothetical protein
MDILERGDWNKKHASMHLESVLLLNRQIQNARFLKSAVHWQAV